MDIIVIVDNVRSAYNVGSIFRSSDGAGVKKVCLCGISPTPKHTKVSKTALGADKSVKWKYFTTTKQAIKEIKDEGYNIWALETSPNAKDFQKVEYPEKIAFVIGHETDGISEDILNLCDCTISIPMRGAKNSLNVSNAISILLYEATRNFDR